MSSIRRPNALNANADFWRSCPQFLCGSSRGEAIHHPVLHASQQFHLQEVDGHSLDALHHSRLSPDLLNLPRHISVPAHRSTLELQTSRLYGLAPQMPGSIYSNSGFEHLAYRHRRFTTDCSSRNAMACAYEVVDQIPRLDHRYRGLRQYYVEHHTNCIQQS